MFPTFISFPSSGDKENIPVIRSEKRARRNALMHGTKSSRRPLLQRVITRCQSITVPTNPTRTRAHSVLPTIHEEVTRSPLSPIYQPSPLSPVSPRAYSILKNPARALPQPSIRNIPLSSPSVPKSRSPLHIVLSVPEKEKREAHPLSLSSIRQYLSLSRITILSNPKKEKRANRRFTQRTKNIRNTLAAALAPKRVPTVSITPISILKAPTTPQTLVPATVAEPNPDAVKKNVKVKFVLSDVVVRETGQGDYDPETGTGVGTTMMSSGEMLDVPIEMLGVPIVGWRGRLDEDQLSRYYSAVHAIEQSEHRLRLLTKYYCVCSLDIPESILYCPHIFHKP